jgi:hypothetical protein
VQEHERRGVWNDGHHVIMTMTTTTTTTTITTTTTTITTTTMTTTMMMTTVGRIGKMETDGVKKGGTNSFLVRDLLRAYIHSCPCILLL